MLGRIAIIGGGVAGLSAARRLTEVGRAVEIFEKARRPGGRISTRRDGPHGFDHGAQYFTCRDERFAAVVESWCERGIAARWEAPIVAVQDGKVRATGDETLRYVGVPGMSALARDLATGLKARCETRIERVTGSPGRWELVAEGGETFRGFQTVLVSTPAPQAVPLLTPVPDLATRVAAVGMEACHTTMVRFEESLSIAFGGAFVDDSPLSWVARNGSKPGRSDGECWVLQTTPAWSAANVDAPPERVGEELLAAFAQAIGQPLPKSAYCSTHRWLYARSAHALGDPFLWDSDSQIGVCGDWTLGGRIEGAWCSGDQLAAAVCATVCGDGAE